VPLVVAEVNPDALANIPKGIVANPNCTTMAVMPALKPLHDEAGLKRLVASTYQAVSGAGLAGIEILAKQLAHVGDRAAELARNGHADFLPAAEKWAAPIAHNIAPLNYVLGEDDYTEEELKLRDESRKILNIPGLPVSGTCVRVPVFTGHGISVNVEFERPISAARALELLEAAPGVVVTAAPDSLAATGIDPVLVGRVRPDRSVEHGLALFVVGDNLRKGAPLMPCRLPKCSVDVRFSNFCGYLTLKVSLPVIL
jgi:aspartate-semialdehyde dehydrogenase